MKNMNIVTLAILTVIVSACGATPDRIGTSNPTEFDQNFNCVVSNYNTQGFQETLTAFTETCYTTGTAVIQNNVEISLNIWTYVNGSPKNASGDVVTLTAVGNTGYFNGNSASDVATVTLSSGLGQATYTPTTTGTQTVTLESSTLTAAGNPNATTTLTFTVQ